jgi:hypothetical protein
VEPFSLDSTYEKMSVIDDCIPHTGVVQICRELTFPHAFSEPEPPCINTESHMQCLAHPLDLLQPVFARQ